MEHWVARYTLAQNMQDIVSSETAETPQDLLAIAIFQTLLENWRATGLQDADSHSSAFIFPTPRLASY